MTRRTFVQTGAAAAPAFAAAKLPDTKLPVCAFSKHFQWLSVPEACQLAASIGYDAIDYTVRAGGHVLPERAADDLPKAVEVAHAAGLATPMVTAGIVNVKTPHAEQVVRTLSKLGIKRYRWGGFRYDTAKPVPQQIDEFRAMSQDLAALNKQYGVCAMYHTHSGAGQFGASMWDIWLTLRDLDNSAVGVNLDIGHATVEGGLGGWINTTRVMAPMLRGIAFKDFRWEKSAKGKWAARWCALGQGMVNFAEFLKMVKAQGYEGPLQLHMEYDELGGADSGKTKMSISKDEFVRLCKHDLETFRSMLRAAGMA
ncbi:MAG: sugar phosphate isomerase/epimerase [Acidobacteria bacterium]|nr:sugar phosphate isomerase/epimerase [Acidobacteriota bacterium]